MTTLAKSFSQSIARAVLQIKPNKNLEMFSHFSKMSHFHYDSFKYRYVRRCTVHTCSILNCMYSKHLK